MVNLVGLEVRLLVSCCHRQAKWRGAEQNEFGLPTGTKFCNDGGKSRIKLCGVAANVKANGSCFNGKVDEPGSEG